MALTVSSIAQICKSLALYLDDAFDDTETKVQVRLGSPADASPTEQDGDHRLNLFFFRFEPSGFGADALPGQTQFLRMHCLVTPFAIAEDSVESGENDLRIIGEVLRVFQEMPVFDLTVNETTFHTQVVFQTLGMDQINQIWSTQGDTIYRPSVMYEVSLAPIIPEETAVPAPLVGAQGLGVETIGGSPTQPVATPPPLERLSPPLEREDWAPATGLVYEGTLAQSISFALGSAELAAFSAEVVVAGEPGTQARLVWDLWDAEHGWRPHTDTTDITLDAATITPETLPSATRHNPSLPFDDRPGQMVLYAERDYVRASDGAPLTRRSNPVLISLYEVSP